MSHKEAQTSLLNFMRLLCFFVVIVTLPLFLSGTALAHDPGLSAAEIQVVQDSIVAELSFAPADVEAACVIDANGEQRMSPKSCFDRLALNALEIRVDGEPLTVSEASAAYDSGSTAVLFRLKFAARAGTRLQLRSTLLQSLARGHKQFVTLRDEHHNILTERMLQNGSDQLIFDGVRLMGRSHSFPEFLLLGIEHILTGYDHLAFLLALLLIGGTLREAGKVISSFTVAHSITLALATFDLVRLPAGVVEPLIAASIVYVGLENLFQRNVKRRWLLTFGFGLIHGLGFASALRDLGIGGAVGEAIIPLLSFNLGVEFGQIAIALLILPLIWKLRQRAAFIATYAPACSVVVTLLGGYWLIERTLLQ